MNFESKIVVVVFIVVVVVVLVFLFVGREGDKWFGADVVVSN